MSRRLVAVTLAVVVQLGLVAVGVGPQLSARALGEEYRLRVAPVDPIDPFRGAYVALDYPDLPRPDEARLDQREVYVPLVEKDGVWVGRRPSAERPESGPYLACTAGWWDGGGCGIESWFLPQDEALEMERAVTGGDAVATVRIDRWGNAALVSVDAS
ncbi:GDYXXLXY domain-containing protein [Nocardioides donggukensis]|uniref:GDYXXLXY domain-containing protein n=1 Tax=Nocardioides donggukensis TaxID=2774019 RepID=A0A927K413_9ACTN|nr:GDYXXLXY domain-containing protein [Nocardioides donggukensis]MBD8868403.1 GDYXXLXY domain-containing protein [Nocardioides donggukensis]